MSEASDIKDIDTHVAEKGGGHPLASDNVSPQTPKKPEPTDGEFIYSTYIERAEKEDQRTAEDWKNEAEQVFLFTGLFSAVVATFISLSIQDIRADRQDTSNFYLAGIHQALTTGSNLSDISLLSSPPPFTPPTFGIWVNSLWFVSLAINMTCAVLANLLQQWARKYLKLTQPHFIAGKPKRARYRAYYADGVENFLLPSVFEALPAMLHLSVFLFFSGLVVFLWNFTPTISKLILSWVAGCVTLYGYMTFIPSFRPDSPYNTPLSPLAWWVVTGVSFISMRVFRLVSYSLNIVLSIVSFIRWCLVLLFFPILYFLSRCCDYFDFLVAEFGGIDLDHFTEAGEHYRKRFFQGMHKAAEKAALGQPSGLNGRALMWTFDSSHEDEELKSFFSSLPYFRAKSDENKQPFLGDLARDQNQKLWTGWIGLLDRTYSPDEPLPEGEKDLRVTICTNAIEVDTKGLGYILDSVTSRDQSLPVRSAELASFIERLPVTTDDDEYVRIRKQAIVSCVVATARRNDKWLPIASKELGADLRNYTVSDLSLAILIHVICQQLRNFKDDNWPRDKFSKVLRAASVRAAKDFSQDASDELINVFCFLWNQIIKMQGDEAGPKIKRFVLRPLYKARVYANIHPPTTGSRFASTSEATDNLKNPRRGKYLPCIDIAHLSDMPSLAPYGNKDKAFASIIKLLQPHSETTSTPPLVTTAPGGSPATSLKTEPGTAAEDDRNHPHLTITTGPRFSPLPSVTDSKGADAGRSLEPKVERTGGDHSPPVSRHGDDIV